ncbi:hypothetical protein TESG_08537 [Trichophyton tonsurans CBS 112818]|uniref:Uncharacterized protein n=2 Tax=Trichophyton TaxID=5550 RepID=F2PMW8_TRIEC|nr:hypothetical protein TESG_08537 [Trichophyton tonsurans CBS 112818]EGE03236.1 hypothetical protein TEQG_02274 [Trichophyton equinum CBS 127.97]
MIEGEELVKQDMIRERPRTWRSNKRENKRGKLPSLRESQFFQALEGELSRQRYLEFGWLLSTRLKKAKVLHPGRMPVQARAAFSIGEIGEIEYGQPLGEPLYSISNYFVRSNI